MSVFVEKKETIEALHITENSEASKATVSETKTDWQQQKQEQAKKRKIQNRYQAVENEIERIDERYAALDHELSLPENASNATKLIELSKEKEALDEKLQTLFDELEELEAKLAE